MFSSGKGKVREMFWNNVLFVFIIYHVFLLYRVMLNLRVITPTTVIFLTLHFSELIISFQYCIVHFNPHFPPYIVDLCSLVVFVLFCSVLCFFCLYDSLPAVMGPTA